MNAARLGQVLGGRWRLERVIGIGGMATVYSALGPGGERVALKLLLAEMAETEEFRRRFLLEGVAANQVDHPGAVRVVDQSPADEKEVYLVMELLQGESVGQRLGREPIQLHHWLRVMHQVLDVLAAAHENGIVHRDLKPDNLFLSTDGQTKVLDFGLARFLDTLPGEVRTKTGTTMGTLPYMAPEQARGVREHIDGRTDLFALGAVSFRVLSGRRIHEAESEAKLLMAMAHSPAPPLSSVAPGLPEPVCQIIDRALEFDREARYPDAVTMQRDLQVVLGGGVPPYASRAVAASGEPTRHEYPEQPAVAMVGATGPARAGGRPGLRLALLISGFVLMFLLVAGLTWLLRS